MVDWDDKQYQKNHYFASYGAPQICQVFAALANLGAHRQSRPLRSLAIILAWSRHCPWVKTPHTTSLEQNPCRPTPSPRSPTLSRLGHPSLPQPLVRRGGIRRAPLPRMRARYRRFLLAGVGVRGSARGKKRLFRCGRSGQTRTRVPLPTSTPVRLAFVAHRKKLTSAECRTRHERLAEHPRRSSGYDD